jgi:hypothetical protein
MRILSRGNKALPPNACALTRKARDNTVLPMTTISFKVTEDEARLIRSLARRERLSLSEYLRRRASHPAPATNVKSRRVRCPHTGALIFATLENQPPLTTESVRELLSNFP